MALNIASVFRLGVQVVAAGFAQTATKISRIESQAVRTGATIDSSVRTLNSRLATLGTTASIAGGALIGIAAVSANATLNMERMATSVDIVGRSAGFATSEIQAMTKAIQDQNFTEAAALKTVIDLTGAMVDFVDVTSLAKIAQDIATAKNMAAAKVMDILTGAIAKANIRGLQSLELGAKNSQLIKATIKSMEGEVKGLTKRQQAQAAWNAILRVGTRFQGAYASASETASRAVELFKLSLDRATVSLGKGVLEAVIPLIKRTTELIDKFNELPESTKNLIGRIVAIAGAVISAAGAFLLLSSALRAVVPSIKASLGVFSLFRKQVIAAMAVTIKKGLAVANTTKYVKGLSGVIGKAIGFLGPWGAALAAVTAFVVLFRKEIGSAVRIITDSFQPAINKAKEFVKSLADSFIVVRAAVSVMVDSIKQAVGTVLNFLASMIAGPLSKLGDEIGAAVVPDFRSLLETFFVGGFKLMGAFAAGIIEGATQVIIAITEIVFAISQFLVGASPPPLGPLSKIDQAGFDLIKAWVDGMYQFPADSLKELAKNVARQLKEALFIISQDLFELESQLLGLERALDPLRDSLFLIEEKAKLIIIPLERERRELARQLDVLNDIADAEEKRRKAQIDFFKERIEAAEKLLKFERERLDLIDHELFIEQIRNKITGQAATIRSLALTSQLRLQKDVVARAEERIRKMREELEEREKTAKVQKELFDKQIEALELQIKAIDRLVEVEEERIKFAQEELELAQALQAEERLLIRQRQRALEDQQRILQNMADIVAQLFFTPKGPKPKEEPFAEGIDTLFETARKGLDDIQKGLNDIDFEALKAKMRAAFDEQTKAAKQGFDDAFENLKFNLEILKVQVEILFDDPDKNALGILWDAVWAVFKEKGSEAITSWIDDVRTKVTAFVTVDIPKLFEDLKFNIGKIGVFSSLAVGFIDLALAALPLLGPLTFMDKIFGTMAKKVLLAAKNTLLYKKSVKESKGPTKELTLKVDLLAAALGISSQQADAVRGSWLLIKDLFTADKAHVNEMTSKVGNQSTTLARRVTPKVLSFKRAWQQVQKFFRGPLTTAFNAIGEFILGAVEKLVEGTRVIGNYELAWGLVKTAMKAVSDFWNTTVKGAFSAIVEFVEKHFIGEGSTFQKFADFINITLYEAVVGLTEKLGGLLGILQDIAGFFDPNRQWQFPDPTEGFEPTGAPPESTRPTTPRDPFGERRREEGLEPDVPGTAPTSGGRGSGNIGGTRDNPFVTAPAGTGLGGGGIGSTSVTNVVNQGSTFNVRANYANNQSEASILNDMQLLQIMAA